MKKRLAKFRFIKFLAIMIGGIPSAWKGSKYKAVISFSAGFDDAKIAEIFEGLLPGFLKTMKDISYRVKAGGGEAKGAVEVKLRGEEPPEAILKKRAEMLKDMRQEGKKVVVN